LVFISDLGDGELGLLQPYAAAMCVSLHRKGKISEFINNLELFRNLLNENINQYFIESEFYQILNSYFKNIELTGSLLA